ncbi:hypothetical protein FF38_08932 [Lucilia cuprina]|uniref:Uncharacterized protein n=1 Tax=Lucilia cuprina TaxID=7375 RepID=A0A0L0C1J7_LUCCU|nr:hypothetical protein FF38_08932 [Lucilia cuprina]
MAFMPEGIEIELRRKPRGKGSGGVSKAVDSSEAVLGELLPESIVLLTIIESFSICNVKSTLRLLLKETLRLGALELSLDLLSSAYGILELLSFKEFNTSGTRCSDSSCMGFIF